MIRHSQALDSYIASDGNTVRMSYAQNGDLLIRSLDGKVLIDVIRKTEMDAAAERGMASERDQNAEAHGLIVGMLIGTAIWSVVLLIYRWFLG